MPPMRRLWHPGRNGAPQISANLLSAAARTVMAMSPLSVCSTGQFGAACDQPGLIATGDRLDPDGIGWR